jgi:predicted DNA-binding transcriptional regulator AlpA
MATSTKSPWLTTTELLSELQVSRSSFDLWRKEGRGPRCYKMPNGQMRIRRADLEEWLSDLEEVLV